MVLSKSVLKERSRYTQRYKKLFSIYTIRKAMSMNRIVLQLFNCSKIQNKKYGFMLLDIAIALAAVGVLCGIIAQCIVYKKVCEHAAFQQARASIILHNAIENLQAQDIDAFQELQDDEYKISCFPCSISEISLTHYKVAVSWNDQTIEALVSGGLSCCKDRL
jgi:Tfp pilus assembly protein PilE